MTAAADPRPGLRDTAPYTSPQPDVAVRLNTNECPHPLPQDFFDELAKLMTNAAGAAQGVRREIDTLVQTQVERVLNNIDVVKREDFEAVKAMAQKAREENDALARRIAELEAKLGGAKTESASDSKAD